MWRNVRCADILDVEKFLIERPKFSFYYSRCVCNSLPCCHLRCFVAKSVFSCPGSSIPDIGQWVSG